MVRRKQIKGVVSNLGNWCISRNFDFDGYCALGKLYVICDDLGLKSISFDLIDSAWHPEEVHELLPHTLAHDIRRIFFNQLTSLRIPNTWLCVAKVRFEFNCPFEHNVHWFGRALGEPFKCLVTVTSDLGTVYESTTGCNLWKHNPQREYRRCNSSTT